MHSLLLSARLDQIEHVKDQKSTRYIFFFVYFFSYIPDKVILLSCNLNKRKFVDLSGGINGKKYFPLSVSCPPILQKPTV